MVVVHIRPMLAATVTVAQLESNVVTFPMRLQPKIDGIRAMIVEGYAMSRSGKPIPNVAVQNFFRSYAAYFQGFDGELVVGEPTARDCYNRTSSGIMSRGGTPSFQYYAFDLWNQNDVVYAARREKLASRIENLPAGLREKIVLTPETEVQSGAETEDRFNDLLFEGHEGAILRHPKAQYKFGRSTLKQGYLLKMKDYVDAEDTVTGFEELYRNGNEAVQSPLGYTVRSSHQANLVPGGCLGLLKVSAKHLGYQDFCIGTGFDQDTRDRLWAERDSLIGRIVRFKYMPSGSMDRPRHPVFLGFRHPIDMGS